jgi:RNA polymerase sigma-70 factor, ECF subfamily
MQLVERAQAGDEESLNRLLERYFHRVRTIVRARMGTRLRRWNDSGDVIQQTFLAAVRRLQNFEMRNDAALINWLSKIAENQIHDLADAMDAGKRRTDLDVSIEELGEASAEGDRSFDVESEAASPAETVSDNEEQTLLDRAMARMTEEYRELILLRDYMGHSWAEVAEETQRPTADAARMKYATARAQLTVLVNEERKSCSEKSS